MFTSKTASTTQPQYSIDGSRKEGLREGNRERIKTAMIKLWTNSFDRGRSKSRDQKAKPSKRSHSKFREDSVKLNGDMNNVVQNGIILAASSQSTNESTITLESFRACPELPENLELDTGNSETSVPCASSISREKQDTLFMPHPEREDPSLSSEPECSVTKQMGVHQKAARNISACEGMDEETWIAKWLKDYCPVRFRRIKHLDYDSPHFRSKQTAMALRAVTDQEQRGGDLPVRFRPDRGSPNSWRRWLHFETDEDILESVDHFIASNRGLPSLFKGTGPAVRRHFFRRWKNVDRDKAIIYDHLRNLWSNDKQAVKKLRVAREERNQQLEDEQFLEELFNGPPDKFPPFSFLVSRAITKVNVFETEPEQELHIEGVPPKRSISSHPYFTLKHRQAKAWFKDLLLGI